MILSAVHLAPVHPGQPMCHFQPRLGPKIPRIWGNLRSDNGCRLCSKSCQAPQFRSPGTYKFGYPLLGVCSLSCSWIASHLLISLTIKALNHSTNVRLCRSAAIMALPNNCAGKLSRIRVILSSANMQKSLRYSSTVTLLGYIYNPGRNVTVSVMSNVMSNAPLFSTVMSNADIFLNLARE